jgi:hypothetical protein
LGAHTKVLDFSNEFGNNPIRKGRSAAKYMKKPQTLAEALGVKTEVVNFEESFGNNPIRQGHSAAKYLATTTQEQHAASKKKKDSNPSLDDMLGNMELSISILSQLVQAAAPDVAPAKKPQTLAEALGVKTEVVNFQQEFGNNPIREGHSAAKYLKKPQTLAEALGAKIEVVNFEQKFGNNPIREGHSAAKYLEAAQAEEEKNSNPSLNDRLGNMGFSMGGPSQPVQEAAVPDKKPQTLAEALGVKTEAVNCEESFGNSPIRQGHSVAKKYLATTAQEQQAAKKKKDSKRPSLDDMLGNMVFSICLPSQPVQAAAPVAAPTKKGKHQTLGEALRVKTEVVNNPIREGHSAVKYLKDFTKEEFGDNKPRESQHSAPAKKYLRAAQIERPSDQTLLDAIGVLTRAMHEDDAASTAKYLEATQGQQQQPKSLAADKLGSLGLFSLDETPTPTKAPKAQTLADTLGLAIKISNFDASYGKNPPREDHSAAKYVKKSQTFLAEEEALGATNNKIVKSEKEFGNNPIREGHSASKYLEAVKADNHENELTDALGSLNTSLCDTKKGRDPNSTVEVRNEVKEEKGRVATQLQKNEEVQILKAKYLTAAQSSYIPQRQEIRKLW